ncbi:pectinesterase-like [Cornus florida]|uniref:pectinesterase-like n=1 Tax=Cornus florida TaxID=4283 RepID=UPI00289E69BC|nr:pectinesterase-like [Cornus florida]
MESPTSTIKSPTDQTSINLKKTHHHKTMITCTLVVVSLTLITILLTSLLTRRHHSSPPTQTKDGHSSSSSSSPLLRPIIFIKKACSNTLYPSLCFNTLSSLPLSNINSTTLHHILEFAINRTMNRVAKARHVVGFLTLQELNSQEKNALKDCLEMLDQTLYELGQAIDELVMYSASMGHHRHRHRSYGNLKTLLSAAMTNENTCIDGFSDLETLKGQKGGHKQYLQNFLTPISRMISNCLAIIKHMETINHEDQTLDNQNLLINRVPENEFQAWMMTSDHRKAMKSAFRIRPNVVVARDGSGKYSTIGEAVSMAPNASENRYVIKIKAGTYKENVEIPREKVNIMLIGDGMNSTVITGSRNFVDGCSAFNSATLTVVGDKFLARDLTIMNTAGPRKHQAVALRVNSNAAFYRCNFTSYQDTLYTHSLRQFYRECTIQGTIDFIFGNAEAIFQNCLILVRKPITGQKNMITAQGREDPNQNTGISLQNCTIVAAPDLAATERGNVTTFLGRPWRNYSRTMIMKSYLGDLIHPRGWFKWDKYSTLDTVEYIECMNFGPGSDTRRRVKWPGFTKNCSEDIARKFTVGEFLHGRDDWLESTGFPIFDGS